MNLNKDRVVFNSNCVFNVNGQGKENLVATLDLVFQMRGYLPAAWRHDEKYGMILYWTVKDIEGINILPAPLSAEEIAPIVLSYLESEKAGDVVLKGWDKDVNHDGHNTPGWRVYCEDWGHVDSRWEAIVAITPAYMWHGK